MPKRIFRKKSVPKAKVNRRRRLQPAYKKPNPPGLRKVAEDVLKEFTPELYYAMKNGGKKVGMTKARSNVQSRIEQSDNITTAKAVTIGKQRPIGFQEKVSRSLYPPLLFKRNYQWSAECSSGRKGIFNIMMNDLVSGKSGGGGLYDDVMTSVVRRLTTDTTTQDPTLVANTSATSMQKFYIDYYSQALQMVNSSSNSVQGKIKLFAYKRDAETFYSSSNIPHQPINMAMFASNAGGNVSIDGGQEGVLSNYGFNNSTPGADYDANYIMPGSLQNTGGATAQVDLAFDPMGPQLSNFTGYFFKLVKTVPFNLKPGQQIKHSTIFNDLPILNRSSIEYAYLAGITYCMQIEFSAGIVGDATVTTGDNIISTGSGQLSCMLVEKRIVGVANRTHTKIVMPTQAPAGIALAAQFTINPDTGAGDVGADQDI